ncbi:MFS transporter [Pikeienuella sp. HZG-20]|uniref:MFS transporter n=1 Tax=Paludibacillus litoralis TaxID=3133267 RepID=UPI0030EEA36D
MSITSAGPSAESRPRAGRYGKTTMAILLAVSASHLLNDIMQSLLTAIYPLLKSNYDLDFVQIGLLTLTFRVTASMLQPVVGMATDRWPMPYSLPVGMSCTFFGLILLGNAAHFPMLLTGAGMIGLGSAVFHPEATRVARLASGGRHGLAQSVFQVGGNLGSALGPLIAAFIVLPLGQGSVAWLSVIAMLGVFILTKVGAWYAQQARLNRGKPRESRALPLPKPLVAQALLVLVALTATKNIYTASLSSYYTFYVIEVFGVSVRHSQILLFIFLGATAAGTIVGGPIGDRWGARFVIWFSILAAIPFALMLPYANLFWTGVLTAVIGLILASAFPAIIVFGQQLMPGRVGMVGGLFFGFSFGFGGLGATLLGALADIRDIEYVYWVCSFVPLLGLLTVLLPRIPAGDD